MTPTLEKPRGKYRRRFIRSRTNKPPLKITERHVEVIQTISANRLMTFSLLAQLYPPDEHARTRRTETPRDTTHSNLRRVLRALFHHSYIDCFGREDIAESVYATAPKGAQLLLDRQLPLPLSLSTTEHNKDFSSVNTKHALMVARFRTSLELALKEHPTLSLYSFEREGKNLKTEWKSQGKRVFVNPDAYFILLDTRNKKPFAYFVECDRSTMTLQRLMDKYKYYAQMYQDGIHSSEFEIDTFRVLTVTKSRERAGNITTLAADNSSSPIPKQLRSYFCFTTEDYYANTPQNVLAAIWRKADNIEKLRGIIPQPLTHR